MAVIVTVNPKVMHGTPCFAGTRVTVQSLFDQLEAGHSVADFLAEFPTVRREQVSGFLEQLSRQAEKLATPVPA